MTPPWEILRYNFKPSVVRLLLAVQADAGPCHYSQWALRAGLPRNHLLAAVQEAERLKALVVDQENPREGMRLLLQPSAGWRERELCSSEEWLRAWETRGQARLDIATERPDLAAALAENVTLEGAHRNPASTPETGCSSSIPKSGTPESGTPESGTLVPLNVERLNVQRSTFFPKSLSTLNAERLTDAPESGTPESGTQARAGWKEPETEAEAMAACARLLAVGAAGAREMENWGGRWRNRWRNNPNGLRKILNMVREDQARGVKVWKSWGAHASDLWDEFIEHKPRRP